MNLFAGTEGSGGLVRTSTTSSWPFLAAMSLAVSFCWLTMAQSGLDSRMMRTNFLRPMAEAMCRGVSPF